MCVKLNSLFDCEMKVYYVTQVLKQGINIKKRNRKLHLLQVLSRCVGQDRNCYRKSVKLLVIVIIVFKRYSSTYCFMQGWCFICSNF